MLGQLPHDVQVRPHVQLAADQHHLGVGTELLGLTLPLQVTRTGTVKHCEQQVRKYKVILLPPKASRILKGGGVSHLKRRLDLHYNQHSTFKKMYHASMKLTHIHPLTIGLISFI